MVTLNLITVPPAPPRVVLELPFARPPITANEARAASHWSTPAAATKTVAAAVYAVVKRQAVPHYTRCRISLIWHTADYHVVDAGSLFPMLKSAIDALTPPRAPIPPKGRRKTWIGAKIGTGTIDADDASVVLSETMAVVLASPPARILLVIDPAQGASRRAYGRGASQ